MPALFLTPFFTVGCDAASDAAKTAKGQVKKQIDDEIAESKKEVNDEIRKAIVDEPEAVVEPASKELCLDAMVHIMEISQKSRLDAMTDEEKKTMFDEVRNNPPRGQLDQCIKAGKVKAECIKAASDMAAMRKCEE